MTTVCRELHATPMELKADDVVIEGGFGMVHFETRNGMKVAVKTSITRETMRHEAHILSCLHHPFLPVLLSFTDTEMVMADLGRQTLTEVLQTPRMWRADYDKIAWCVASALAYMHALEFQHSDVKCDNVIVDSFGDAVLIDFNLSGKPRSGLSSTRCGSLSYVSPEVYSNRSPWDAFKADVWSFSVLYFAILYRHLPFDVRHTAYQRYAMLHASHGSVGSLRMVWSGSHIFDRGDVKKIHETVLDLIMHPEPSNRPSMASVEHSLYCLKYGLQCQEPVRHSMESSTA
jgi:serine/threonine protein kinase